jgi:large subunit ribosomal protein L13
MDIHKTYIAKDKDIKREWYVLDARDKVLGRLASRVAGILRGKDKVIFSPHQDTGDEVIIINARHVRVTGKKMAEKVYKRYSAYPGGLNTESLEKMMKKNPQHVITHAVKGMLPKNKLGAKLLKKLRVYPDEAHAHQAQKPKALKLD